MFLLNKDKKQRKLELEDFIDNVEKVHPKAKYKHPLWTMLYGVYQNVLKNLEGMERVLSDTADVLDMENFFKDSSFTEHDYVSQFIYPILGKMFVEFPAPFVRAATNDADDINAARISTAALKDWWRTESVLTKWRRKLFWSLITGFSYSKVWYNGESESDSEGEGDLLVSMRNFRVEEGRVIFEDKNPFMGYPDFQATRPENMRWFVDTFTLPVDMLKVYYPRIGDKITADADSAERGADSVGMVDFDAKLDVGENSGIVSEESVLVREYWERAYYKVNAGWGKGRGRLMIRASGETLYDGPNPYYFMGENSLPFYVYAFRQDPGSLYGRGLVDPLIPYASDKNRLMSQVLDNFDAIGDAVFVQPQGSKVGKMDPGYGIRQTIEWDPQMGGREPHQMDVRPLPEQSLNVIGELEAGMVGTSSLSELSFSRLPPRSSQTSGRVTDSLGDAEEVRFSLEVENVKEVMVAQASAAIELMQHFYDEKHFISVTSENEFTEVVEFVGSNLDGHRDVYVEMQSGFGQGTSRRRETQLNLFDRGLIPPEDLLKDRAFRGTTTYSEVHMKAEAKARRDLELLLVGQMPFLSLYDNHAMIVPYIKSYLQTTDAERRGPDVRNLIETYIDEHQRLAAEEVVRRQMIVRQAQMKMQVMQDQQGQQSQGGPQQQQSQARVDEQIGRAEGNPGV